MDQQIVPDLLIRNGIVMPMVRSGEWLQGDGVVADGRIAALSEAA